MSTALSVPVLTGPIERIGIFRALMLGDMLCAVPALRAVRKAFPSACITLLGLPWVRALAERLSCVDEVIDFPGYPGLPEVQFNPAALPEFLSEVLARRFDLVLQLHGSGRIVNPLISTFGARQTAGFFDDAAWLPPHERQRYVPWPESGHEIHRLLRLTDALGLRREGVHSEFPIEDHDREILRALCPQLSQAPYVCVHPGAQLASRRWPAPRFAAVADAMAEKGYSVVLTGTASETLLASSVMNTMQQPAISLVGQTSLWTLGALLERAECLVCNDTGVSHIAAALGTPSVVVSCGADVARWTPLDSGRHRVLWAATHCRPCGFAECPYGHGCATAIDVGQVLGMFDMLCKRA